MEAPASITGKQRFPAHVRRDVTFVPLALSRLDVQMFNALGNCVIDQRPGAETAPLQSSASVETAPLQSDNHTLNPIPYTLTLDVSQLPAGIYFLRLSGDGYAASREFIIER